MSFLFPLSLSSAGQDLGDFCYSFHARERRKLKEIYHDAASVSILMNKNTPKYFMSLMINKWKQFVAKSHSWRSKKLTNHVLTYVSKQEKERETFLRTESDVTSPGLETAVPETGVTCQNRRQ